MRALALCGGLGHPAAEALPTLEFLFDGAEIHTEPEAGLSALDRSRHDVLVVSALAFTMADARYDEVRAEHAFSLSDRGRSVVDAWIGDGGPLLALHTAAICFDDWPRWSEILGARWVWGRSHHPPLGPMSVEVPGRASFEVVDERYSDLEPTGDRQVVATSDGHPVLWRRTVGRAPVVVDLLGHDARSLRHPDHRDLLVEQVAWIQGALACDTS